MRTPEQIAADEAVREVILAQQRAYSGGDDAGVLTDVLILGVRQTFDSDGYPVTTNFAMHCEESIPLYRLLGLAEYAAAVYRRDIACSDEP